MCPKYVTEALSISDCFRSMKVFKHKVSSMVRSNQVHPTLCSMSLSKHWLTSLSNTCAGKADDVTTCGSTNAKFTFKMYKFSKYKPGHQAHGVPPAAMGTATEEEDAPGEEEAKPSLTLLVPQQLLSQQYIHYLASGQTTMELASIPPANTQGDNMNGDDIQATGTRT